MLDIVEKMSKYYSTSAIRHSSCMWLL